MAGVVAVVGLTGGVAYAATSGSTAGTTGREGTDQQGGPGGFGGRGTPDGDGRPGDRGATPPYAQDPAPSGQTTSGGATSTT